MGICDIDAIDDITVYYAVLMQDIMACGRALADYINSLKPGRLHNCNIVKSDCLMLLVNSAASALHIAE